MVLPLELIQYYLYGQNVLIFLLILYELFFTSRNPYAMNLKICNYFFLSVYVMVFVDVFIYSLLYKSYVVIIVIKSVSTTAILAFQMKRIKKMIV